MARSAAEPWVPKCQQETGRENGSAVTPPSLAFWGYGRRAGLRRQRFCRTTEYCTTTRWKATA